VERPEAARVRDRERAALDVVRQELLRPRALGDVLDRPSGAREVEILRVADDRDDEPLALVERDGDATEAARAEDAA